MKKLIITSALLILLSAVYQYTSASPKIKTGYRHNAWSTSTFAPGDSSLYEYDGAGKITLQHNYLYNSGTGWKESSKIIFTYNNDLLTNQTTYGLSTGSPVNSIKTDYTYNGNGNLLTQALYIWSSGTWVGVKRTTNTYDTQQRIASTTTENWNYSTNNWKNYQRSQYSYFYQQLVGIQINQNWDNTNSVWNNHARIQHVYNSMQLDSGIDYQIWDGGSSQWLEQSFSIYTYNIDRKVTLISNEHMQYIMILGGSFPVIDSKVEYSYTDTVLTSVYRLVPADNTGSNFRADLRTVYTLDINNRRYLETNETFDTISSNWKGDTRIYYDYDADGYLIHTTNQTGDGTGWVNANEYYYWYTQQTATGMDEIIPQIKLSSAYPNPFTNGVNIAFELSKAQDVAVQVIDLTGRLQNETTMSGIEGANNWFWNGNKGGIEVAAGTYIVNIVADNYRQTQKIIKQ